MPATLFDLLDALNRVLARVPEPTVYEIEAEVHSVEEKIAAIGAELAEYGTVPFARLLGRCRTRVEMIVTFIALLEVIRLGHALVIQDELFGDVTIVASAAGGKVSHAARST
jgi:segregation and condensation protein A